MKVSLLCANLSSNALGRAYMLARILERRHEVELIGAAFGNGIWPPCDTGEYAYKMVRSAPYPIFWRKQRNMRKMITGDVVYAIKPRPASFGTALRSNRPIVLDIDDWDAYGDYALTAKQRLLQLLRLYHPYSNTHLHRLARHFSKAAAITTVSSTLQQQFGGTIIPHARDTDYLNPANFDGSALRQEWGLADHTIVMFLGTPRPHKGIEELAQAVRSLADLPLTLVVVGANSADSYTRTLQSLGGDRLRLLGMQPFEAIPRFLAAADIVALPQRDVPFAHAQLPAKIFDAMAMAKPLIVSDVGDLAQVVGQAGSVVPPNDIPALAAALRHYTTDQTAAHKAGRTARQRCINHFSWNVFEPVLSDLFQNVWEAHAHAT